MHRVNSNYLFVYSSLLKGFRTPEYEYVSRYFDFVGEAKTKGVLSILDHIIAGTPTEDDRYIKGELYKIREDELFSFAIGQLDEYEGVQPEPPLQPLYKRDVCMATTPDNQQFTAWVYWYTGDVTGCNTIESGDMLMFLKEKQ